jgi:hypothetical protein
VSETAVARLREHYPSPEIAQLGIGEELSGEPVNRSLAEITVMLEA